MATERRITDAAGNRRLWKKAYMAEFYSGENSESPSDVFTFALPPQSEEFKWGQRKSETKTFGGLFVAEYGADEAKITLSGSTVNNLLKRVHLGEGRNDKWLSGEDEIFLFRDRLLWYRQVGLLREGQGKIVITDLSKEAEGRSARWRAYPGEFSIRRDSDKPFAYKYTFEFTGASETELPDPAGEPPALTALDNAQAALDKAYMHTEDLVHEVQDRFGVLTDGLGKAGALLHTAGDIGHKPQGVITGVFKDVFAGTRAAIAGGAHIGRAFSNIPRRNANFILELQNEAQAAVAQWRDFEKAWGDWDSGRPKRGSGGEEEKEEDNSGIPDSRIDAAAAVMLTGFAVSGFAASVKAQISGQESGYQTVTVKQGDSLESVAASRMGSPDKAGELALFNGIGSIEDVPLGGTLKIPARAGSRAAANRIWARAGDADNYGRDIKLGEDGFIQAGPGGDFALVSGPANLAQALVNRVKESSRRRIRLAAYGIRKNIGDPDLARAHILSSIRQTAAADPRVAEVSGVKFRAAGDALAVEIGYTDISGAAGAASGEA